MARNRSIKILNELILENPKHYVLMHNSKNYSRRPMTVNYQAPLDSINCHSKRPFSSHLNPIEQNSTSFKLKVPPLPNIRDIAQEHNLKINQKSHQHNNYRYQEIPKNTITSLRNESYFWKVKRKVSKSSSFSSKKHVINKVISLKGEKAPNCHKNNYPSLPSDTTSSNNIGTTEESRDRKLPNQDKNPCGQSSSQNKRKSGDKPCKVCVPLWDESSKSHLFQKPRPHTSIVNNKHGFKLTEFSQIEIDSSSYLLKEIDNIKAEITKMQSDNTKITMPDAVKLINDIKSKIKAAHSTVELENRMSKPRTARVKTPTKQPLVRPSKLLNENSPKKFTGNKSSDIHTKTNSYMQATVSSFNKQNKKDMTSNHMYGLKYTNKM